MTKEHTPEEIKYRLSDLGVQIGNIAIEYITDLEKENAELKDYRLTTLAKQQTEMSKYALNLEHKLGWYDDQLTKAKNLLAKWVELYKPKSKTALPTPIQIDTEQFLNSEVEK